MPAALRVERKPEVTAFRVERKPAATAAAAAVPAFDAALADAAFDAAGAASAFDGTAFDGADAVDFAFGAAAAVPA